MRAAGAEPPRGRLPCPGPSEGQAVAPGEWVPRRDTSTHLGGRRPRRELGSCSGLQTRALCPLSPLRFCTQWSLGGERLGR